MKATIMFLTMVLVLGACGGSDSPSAGSDEVSAEVMAAASFQMVTKGWDDCGVSPDQNFEIQSQVYPDERSHRPLDAEALRELTDVERAAIEEALAPLGPVSFVDDASHSEKGSVEPEQYGPVNLWMGEPTITRTSALVPVSVRYENLCGVSLTYRVELVDSTWTVTGHEGNISAWIS
jgi:hypothetical protein